MLLSFQLVSRPQLEAQPPTRQRASSNSAFALLPLNRERSALTQKIVALEEIASMARKQGAAGTDIAVSAAVREQEARK